MKKLAIAAAMVGLVGSFVWSAEANASRQMEITTKYKTISEAKELAVSEVGGKVTDIEFEREGGYVFYEVEVLTETEEIDVEVNAVTGEVVVTERERLRGAKPSGNGQSVIVKPGKSSEKVDEAANETSLKPEKKPVKESVTEYITKEQAKDIAKKRVGKLATVTDVERDGNYYEVELKRGKMEYEVKINAKTGKIVKYKVERD